MRILGCNEDVSLQASTYFLLYLQYISQLQDQDFILVTNEDDFDDFVTN